MKQLFLIMLSLYGLRLNAQTPIDVVESTFKVSGLTEEKIYFAFAEGDDIILNFEEINNKELKEIEVLEYPSTSKYMDYKTVKVENKKIHVNKTGIYVFRFNNTAVGGRVCKYKLQRIPANESTIKFNTSIEWRKVNDTTFYFEKEKYLIKREYITHQIVPVSEHWINSASNAVMLGGKSRILIPVALPKNTVEWYYTFGASRNKDEMEKAKGKMNLVGELTKLIPGPGQALSIGLDLITKPPGADYCDVYLLDHANSSLFEGKYDFNYFTEGTRTNIKNGVVKVTNGNNELVYLGLRNPDMSYGLDIVIEVAAIILNEEWGIRDVKKFKIQVREVPFMINN